MTDDGSKFTDIEGQFWDFKEEWPFSYSDGYFGGICRLICAFANSNGGLIVFGVSDKTRLAGKNKVRPNLDKLLLAFEQLTGEKFNYDLKNYADLPEIGTVDVLLIRPRDRAAKPLTFKRTIESYRETVIWLRASN